jgi:UDP-N-acetylmuramyl pentapeptide phosphotransferase/UDP-N-acetylglucosamine-1-phosphate transferase
MRTYVFAYLGSAFLAVILTPLVIRLARRIGAVDVPSLRSVHTQPIPRIGGVAIFFSTIGVIVALLFLSNAIGGRFRELRLQLTTLLCLAAFIFAIGLVDDLRGLPARFKFFAEVAAAGGLYFVGVKIKSIGITDGFVLQLGWLAFPVTVLWVVGITNAVNMSDGLDGLAAGVSAITCAVIAVFAIHSTTIYDGSIESNSVMMAVFALALLGSLCGFLIFNFNPAKVFMGDSGSLFLGFTIAATSVVCASKTTALVALALPALALGIPIFDTLFSMLRRWLERRSVFAADRGHFHHRLLDLGLNHRHAVLAIYLATASAAGLGLLMMFSQDLTSVALFGLILLLLIVLFRFVGAVRLRDTMTRLQEKYSVAQCKRQETKAFEHLQLRFRRVSDRTDWWEAICEAADRMDFAWISLKTTHEDGRIDTEVWRAPKTSPNMSRIVTMKIPSYDENAGAQQEFEIAIWANGSLEAASRRASLFGRLLDEHEANSTARGDLR